MPPALPESASQPQPRPRPSAAAGVAYLTQLADFLEALVGFTDVHSPLLSEVERGGLLRTEQPLNLPHFIS